MLRRTLQAIAILFCFIFPAHAQHPDWEAWLAGLMRLEPQLAFEKLRQAPQKYRELADYHYWLGVFSLNVGRPEEEARQHFEYCLLLDPEHAGAWYDLGLSYCRSGDQASCLTILEQARNRFGAPPSASQSKALLLSEFRFSLGHSSNYNRGTRMEFLDVMLAGQHIPFLLETSYRAKAATFHEEGLGLRYSSARHPQLAASVSVLARSPLGGRDKLGSQRFFAGEIIWHFAPAHQLGYAYYRLDASHNGGLHAHGPWWQGQPWENHSLRVSVALERRIPDAPLPAYLTTRMEMRQPLWRDIQLGISFEADLPEARRPGRSQQRQGFRLGVPLKLGKVVALDLELGSIMARDSAPYSALFGATIRHYRQLEAVARLAWPLGADTRLEIEYRHLKQKSNLEFFALDDTRWRMSMSRRF